MVSKAFDKSKCPAREDCFFSRDMDTYVTHLVTASMVGWTGKDGSPSPTLGTIIKILW